MIPLSLLLASSFLSFTALTYQITELTRPDARISFVSSSQKNIETYKLSTTYMTAELPSANFNVESSNGRLINRIYYFSDKTFLEDRPEDREKIIVQGRIFGDVTQVAINCFRGRINGKALIDFMGSFPKEHNTSGKTDFFFRAENFNINIKILDDQVLHSFTSTGTNNICRLSASQP